MTLTNTLINTQHQQPIPLYFSYIAYVQIYQWVAPVGLGFRNGRRFSRKSFSSPLSFRVPVCCPVTPLAYLATLNKTSVIFSRDNFSPWGNLFFSSSTWRLHWQMLTWLLHNRFDRRSVHLFRWWQHPHFVCEFVCWQVNRRRVDEGDNCGWRVRSLCLFDQRIFVPE